MQATVIKLLHTVVLGIKCITTQRVQYLRNATLHPDIQHNKGIDNFVGTGIKHEKMKNYVTVLFSILVIR